MNELTRIANFYACDKGTQAPATGHHGPRLHFTEVYSDYFLPLKDQHITILEIGVSNGPSMKLWYDYFTNAKIFGVDISPNKEFTNDRVCIDYIDQDNKQSMEDFVKRADCKFDIIIDDGSHVCKHQQNSLGVLFKYLNPGGQYWIEDLHTSDIEVWKPGVKLYGYDMGDNTGDKNTVTIIERFVKTKTFNSVFLTQEENEYITSNTKDIKLWEIGETFYGKNKLARFERK